MPEDVAHPRRSNSKQYVRHMRTHAKGASSTRLNKLASRNSALVPLTSLVDSKNSSESSLKEQRQRSSESLIRTISQGRLKTVGQLAPRTKRNDKPDENANRPAVIQLDHADSDESNSYEDTESEDESAQAGPSGSGGHNSRGNSVSNSNGRQLNNPTASGTPHSAGSGGGSGGGSGSSSRVGLASGGSALGSGPGSGGSGRGAYGLGGGRPGMPRRTSSGLSIGISSIEPTPPQISNETVVSVTSMVEMANALNSASGKSRFLDDGDLVSKAVSHSQSGADLKNIVGNNPMRTQQRLLIKQRQGGSYDNFPGTNSYVSPGVSFERKENERAFKEYLNARQLGSPVVTAQKRLLLRKAAMEVQQAAFQDAFDGAKPVSAKSPAAATPAGSVPKDPADEILQRKVASLAATTVNEMEDLTLDARDPNRSGSMTSYILQNMWGHGWQDPETAPGPGLASAQAQKVHQRISAPQWSRQRRNSSIKLV